MSISTIPWGVNFILDRNSRYWPSKRIHNEAKMDADKFSARQPIQHRPAGSWASTLIDYSDSKTGLLAIESRGASQHFVGLLMLVEQLVLASSSALIRAAFPRYLVSLLFHLAWVWSALISTVILSLPSVRAFFFYGCDSVSRFFG
jgi:hypothetical protein